jgi:hypothetical protein
MSSQLTPDPTQSLTLRAFTALQQLRPTWGGALILSLGLNRQAATLTLAANIAGAVSLAIDNDPEALREAARTGAVDFTVNTLDEAIRAIKNEVRKHTPLAVALAADPVLVLDEILERGLAPQLFSTFLPPHPRIAQAAKILHSLGAALIDFTDSAQPPPGFRPGQSLLNPLLEARDWTLHTFTFETPTSLRHFDAEVLARLPSEDTLRHRWLEAAPLILQRQRPPHRTLWLTPTEYATLKRSPA